MRILYIIPWIPYPLSSGGAQAFFNYADVLRHDNNTTLLLSVHNDEEDENAAQKEQRLMRKISKMSPEKLKPYEERLAAVKADQDMFAAD